MKKAQSDKPIIKQKETGKDMKVSVPSKAELEVKQVKTETSA